MDTIMQLKKYFDGEQELKRAFWLFWVVGGGALGVLYTMSIPLAGLLLKGDPRSFLPYLDSGLDLLLGIYSLVAGFVVWRNAANTRLAVWAWVARVIVIFAYVENIAQLAARM